MESISKWINPCTISVGVCIFLTLVTSAKAYTGVELGRDCRSTDAAAEARCEGFVNGFLAGAQVDVEGEPIAMWRFFGYTWCGPKVVEVPEVVEALLESVLEGYATSHHPAPIMLAQSLSSKFPCKELVMPGFPRSNFLSAPNE